jgi:hypothetical protein
MRPLHYGSLLQAALTIATIPAFTALGRLSHAAMTFRRSSGRSDIHMTCSERKNVSFGCSDMSFSCGDTWGDVPPSVMICWSCVVRVLRWCSSVKMEAAGIEPAISQSIPSTLPTQKPHKFGQIPNTSMRCRMRSPLPYCKNQHFQNTHMTVLCAKSRHYPKQ